MEQQPNRHLIDYVREVHRHSMRHLKLWFIPHEENDHHPHALRPKALKAYAMVLIAVKIFTAAFLFAIFPNPGQFAALTAKTMVDLTNQARQQNGLKVLTIDPKLTLAAQNKVNDMLAKGYFNHTSPDGTHFYIWIQKAGYNYSTAGENLAMDFTSAESAESALLNSPTHRANILNTKYTQVGMAVASGTMDGSETTLLVEEFGAPYVAPTPTVEVKAKTTTKKAAVSQKTPTPPKTTTKTTPTPTKTNTTKGEETTIPAPQPVTTAQLSSQTANTISVEQGGQINVDMTFKNSGTTTWSAQTELLPNDQTVKDLANIGTFSAESIQTPVNPGDSVTLTISVTDIQQPGNYSLGFNLVDSGKAITGSNANFSAIISQKTPVPVAINSIVSTEQATPAQVSAATQILQQPSKTSTAKNGGGTSNIILTTNRFFFVFLIYLIIALVLNVVIKARIQHGHVIVQVVGIIALAGAALLTRLNYLEQLGRVIKLI